MKNLWIIANWKSNKNIQEALGWLEVVGPKLDHNNRIKIAVCPIFSDLAEFKKAVSAGNYPILIGSQDLSPFGEGSYTGEEPAEIIKDLVDLAIIGHSERRNNFSETDEIVAKKVDQSRQYNIMPLVCVQSADTPVPTGCDLVAYEPVFAIGTGQPDTPNNANYVAQSLKQKYPDIKILYGGSVNATNCRVFIDQPAISGLLIGKASLEPAEFIKIIKGCL